jgi:hypothetical protein
MEEMLEDAMDIGDDEELEEEADAEVDKVLFELTDGKLGEAGKVSSELPVSASSDFILRLRVTLFRPWRTGYKTRTRNEIWRSIDRSSADCSADSSQPMLWIHTQY